MKERLKPISLHGLKVDDVLRAAMQVKPEAPAQPAKKSRKKVAKKK